MKEIQTKWKLYLCKSWQTFLNPENPTDNNVCTDEDQTQYGEILEDSSRILSLWLDLILKLLFTRKEIYILITFLQLERTEN